MGFLRPIPIVIFDNNAWCRLLCFEADLFETPVLPTRVLDNAKTTLVTRFRDLSSVSLFFFFFYCHLSAVINTDTDISAISSYRSLVHTTCYMTLFRVLSVSICSKQPHWKAEGRPGCCREGGHTRLFKYGDNSISPGRHSWCYTLLFTRKVPQLVV